MQTAILAILFLVLTTVSYFAYPIFGIPTKTQEEKKGNAPPQVAATVDKPAPLKPADPEPVKPVSNPEPPEPSKPEKPVVTTPKPPTPTPTEPTAPVPDADGFTPPKFEPIEKYVNDWKYIPPTVFPTKVVLGVDVVFKSAIGGSTFRAGSPAVALSEQDGVLTVAPTETAPVRGQIAMADTNLKEVMTGMYDNWKRRKTLTAKAAFLYKQNASVRRAAADRIPDARKMSEAGARPTQNADGTVPICIASMQARDVTEIKPAVIERWGGVEFEEIDGSKFWTVTVNYKSKTLFGTFDTEAQALIKHDKVVKWIYTGSGEIVP